jgi:hypothetical protein
VRDKYWFALLLGFLLGWFVLPAVAPDRRAPRAELPDVSAQWPDWSRRTSDSSYAYPPLGYPPYILSGREYFECWDTYGACE